MASESFLGKENSPLTQGVFLGSGWCPPPRGQPERGSRLKAPAGWALGTAVGVRGPRWRSYHTCCARAPLLFLPLPALASQGSSAGLWLFPSCWGRWSPRSSPNHPACGKQRGSQQ